MKAFLVSHDDHYDFLWNIDCSVGRGGQNSLRTDVRFIQWYYQVASTQPETPPDRRAAYSAVKVSGECTGRDDDPLVRAILMHQRAIGHPIVDGRVSVARAGIKIGDTAFFVLRLGARLARMFPDVYPRLDLVTGCPPDVAAEMKKIVPVLPTAA
jgi:hypothetical protein